MGYRGAQGPVKCRIFPLTLKKAALSWFQSLKKNFIGSWTEFVDQFSAHFTASKVQPKSTAALAAIQQRKDESIRDYVERFNKEAILVKKCSDEMKLYLLEQGLIEGSLFSVDIGVDKPKTLNEFLKRAQKFMNYEEKLMASKAKGKTQEKAGGQREDKSRREKESRGPSKRYDEYTPLNTTPKRILNECANTEFRDAGVKFPQKGKEKPNADKSKYCHFHKCAGHETDECFHLKDVIEQLIQKGKLTKYVKAKPRSGDRRSRSRSSRPPKKESASVAQHDEAARASEEKSRPPPVAMVISGGFSDKGGASINSAKRKLRETMTVSTVFPSSSRHKGRPPLAFSDEDLVNGRPNHLIPLLVKAYMANFDV